MHTGIIHIVNKSLKWNDMYVHVLVFSFFPGVELFRQRGEQVFPLWGNNTMYFYEYYRLLPLATNILWWTNQTCSVQQKIKDFFIDIIM